MCTDSPSSTSSHLFAHSLQLHNLCSCIGKGNYCPAMHLCGSRGFHMTILIDFRSFFFNRFVIFSSFLHNHGQLEKRITTGNLVCFRISNSMESYFLYCKKSKLNFCDRNVGIRFYKSKCSYVD